MGRKADPKGKDRPRTIVLSGDVADIAQKLADKGELSATLSELLRYNYGFSDKLEDKKRELTAILDEKQRLGEYEAAIYAQIEDLEAKALENQAQVKPALVKRRQILLQRLAKTEKSLMIAFDHNEITRLHNVISNLNEMIVEVDAELEALK